MPTPRKQGNCAATTTERRGHESVSNSLNMRGSEPVEASRNDSLALMGSNNLGQWLHIGTAQTGDESDTTILTETAAVLSVSGTTITIAGAAPLGGLLYDHAALATVANNATVYIGVFGGKHSSHLDD